MIDSLLNIYIPLVTWTLVGLIFLRKVPNFVPKLIGHFLYWVGVPLQVFGFMQRADLSSTVWAVPVIVAAALLSGFAIAWLVGSPLGKEERGSFLLSAILGNVGFVGLAITPYLVDDASLSWVVLFSLAHNVMGSYGIGVAISSYYGEHDRPVNWLTHLKSVITTPALWAFGLGVWQKLQHIELSEPLASSLQSSVHVVAPIALILVGIRFRQIQSWKGLTKALPAVGIKLIFLPLLVGLGMTLVGITGMPRLAMVLEAGMPTALAGVILAEEYNVNQELIVLSIALSSVGVLATIPLWLWLFAA